MDDVPVILIFVLTSILIESNSEFFAGEYSLDYESQKF